MNDVTFSIAIATAQERATALQTKSQIAADPASQTTAPKATSPADSDPQATTPQASAPSTAQTVEETIPLVTAAPATAPQATPAPPPASPPQRYTEAVAEKCK